VAPPAPTPQVARPIDPSRTCFGPAAMPISTSREGCAPPAAHLVPPSCKRERTTGSSTPHAHALQHPQRAQDPLALCLLQYHSHLTVLQAGPLSRVQIGVRWLSPLWNRVTGSQLGKGGLKPAIPVFMLGWWPRPFPMRSTYCICEPFKHAPQIAARHHPATDYPAAS